VLRQAAQPAFAPTATARCGALKIKEINGASWSIRGIAAGVNPGFRAEGW